MQIDFNRLDNEKWNYIKELFPISFLKITEWNFSIDDEYNPYDLWFDDHKMYEFFDSEKIFVCPRVNTENEFYVEVWSDGVLKYEKDGCWDRTEAEIFGFLFAMDLLNKKT